MITNLCRDRINRYDDDNEHWRLANRVLYNLVSTYPRHNDENEIVSKMWIIGRTYAAAVERRPNRDETPGDFYYDHVAPRLIQSELDQRLDNIRVFQTINENNLPQILSVHKYLEDQLNDITTINKRSLASKYLHFHLPELFFIYDSRVASVITQFAGRTPNNLRIPDNCDSVYATFCYKALLIYNELDNEYIDTKTRVVDNILSRYCDEIERQATNH